MGSIDKRVTIMIDRSLDKKIRLLQANRIKESNSSYSFSKVVGELLSAALQYDKGKKRT